MNQPSAKEGAPMIRIRSAYEFSILAIGIFCISFFATASVGCSHAPMDIRPPIARAP